jgi:hypothetical protein
MNNTPLVPSSQTTTTTASTAKHGSSSSNNEENASPRHRDQQQQQQQQQWCIHVKSVATTTMNTSSSSPSTATTEKDVSVCISPHRTVRDLKSSIETYTGVPEARQRLIYRGRILQDDSIPLHAIEGLSDSHTIHLVPRPVLVQPTTTTQPPLSSNTPIRSLDGIRASGMTSVRQNSSLRFQSSSSLSPPTTRSLYRYSEDDFRVENPGSLEPIQQTLWTLNTTTMNTNGHHHRQFQVGQWIDCRDTVNQWLEATVMQIVNPQDMLAYPIPSSYSAFQETQQHQQLPTTDPAVPVTDLEGRRKLLLEPCSQQHSTEQIDGEYYRPRSSDRQQRDTLQILHIHYNGWPVRWDEWIRSDSERIRIFRARTRHHHSSAPNSSPSVACPRIDTPVDIPNRLPPLQATELLPNLSQAIQQLQQQIHHVVDLNSTSSSNSSSSTTTRRDHCPEYWELAARLDRLGRALTEAAPHVASWNHPTTSTLPPSSNDTLHASIEEEEDREHSPSERNVDNDTPNTHNNTDDTPEEEPPTTLGGLLSLLSGGNQRRRQQRRRRRQDGDVDDQSHDDTTYQQPPSISSSYIALSSQQSVPTVEDDDDDEEEEEDDDDDAEEGEEREETSTVAATADTIRNENHPDTHSRYQNPDYTDFGFSMINTTRGSTGLRRSGARWISSNTDDTDANNNNNNNNNSGSTGTLAGLLGAYIAAASLMDDDGLGRLLRATNGGGGTNGGGIDIHIHAVVTTPDGGIMATTLPTANAIVEPSLDVDEDDEAEEAEEEEQHEERVPTPPLLRRPPPLSPHPNRLFATRSPVDGRRSRHHFSLHPRHRASNENNPNGEVDDEDEGIFDALYSENPEPIDPRQPPLEEVEEQEGGVIEGHRQPQQQSQQSSSSSSTTTSSSSSRGSNARRSNQPVGLSRFFRRHSPGDSRS